VQPQDDAGEEEEVEQREMEEDHRGREVFAPLEAERPGRLEHPLQKIARQDPADE